ncbi:MAG: hypothetical protein ACI3ZS_07045 [Candidatus Cryptobacteroides sp.]
MKINKDIVFKAVTVIMAVAVVIIAVFIMVRRLGLVEGYDFGVGAYYYVDVPDFDKVVPEGAYSTEVPVWVHVVLFVAWGWLMWRLWLWIDRKSK